MSSIQKIYCSADLPDGSYSILCKYVPKDIANIVDLYLDSGPNIRRVRTYLRTENYQYGLPRGLMDIEHTKIQIIEVIIDQLIKMFTQDPKFYAENMFWVDYYQHCATYQNRSPFIQTMKDDLGNDFGNTNSLELTLAIHMYLFGEIRLSVGDTECFIDRIAKHLGQKYPKMFDTFPDRNDFIKILTPQLYEMVGHHSPTGDWYGGLCRYHETHIQNTFGINK